MNALLSLSRVIDAVNGRLGRAMYWLVLVTVIISALNAVVRYAFNLSSNAFLEIQWYFFGLIFLFSASSTLLDNAHVRIDLVSQRFSPRNQAWIDVFGSVFMLLPVCAIIVYYAWPMAMESLAIREMSPDAGGLPRWPIKLVVPLAFASLFLQGVSECIKKIGFIVGHPACQPKVEA